MIVRDPADKYQFLLAGPTTALFPEKWLFATGPWVARIMLARSSGQPALRLCYYISCMPSLLYMTSLGDGTVLLCPWLLLLSCT